LDCWVARFLDCWVACLAGCACARLCQWLVQYWL
jgi:hypothetical protein